MAANHFGPHHVYQFPTTYMLQDKTKYSGDLRKGTRVFNPDGSVAFSTKERMLALRNKETIFDALGQPMATLHKKTLSIHGTWQIFRGDSVSSNDLVAEVTPSLMSLGGKTIRVTLKGENDPVFIVKGNFLGRQFEFLRGNQIIAQSKRQGKLHSVTNFLSGEDTFTLNIIPGVDTALVVATTLVIDDILEPNKS